MNEKLRKLVLLAEIKRDLAFSRLAACQREAAALAGKIAVLREAGGGAGPLGPAETSGAAASWEDWRMQAVRAANMERARVLARCDEARRAALQAQGRAQALAALGKRGGGK